MKYVVAAMVSAMTLTSGNFLKPLNPALGETLQVSMARHTPFELRNHPPCIAGPIRRRQPRLHGADLPPPAGAAPLPRWDRRSACCSTSIRHLYSRSVAWRASRPPPAQVSSFSYEGPGRAYSYHGYTTFDIGFGYNKSPPPHPPHSFPPAVEHASAPILHAAPPHRAPPRPRGT